MVPISVELLMEIRDALREVYSSPTMQARERAALAAGRLAAELKAANTPARAA